ncbi:hypothetical protein INR49_019678 [Caranx melampygus]|nr:hypothetical protein INR49_019678 [Caranx melampygus]
MQGLSEALGQSESRSLPAASSTDSSLARIPPILLNAGIWIPYLSSSTFMLVISSSAHTAELIEVIDLLQGNGVGSKSMTQFGEDDAIPKPLLQLCGSRKLLPQTRLHPPE